ncbi:hypothetical protein ETD86_34735 [Nonomuraea turkmeniaca]|uniref:Uncharacterized protein n=1 Tax=Nonomuraea turkmeniaca TaxID=103838 RepID=A0A5S4FQV4_9ACTN|nr:hypothetical protein [Nonomuraea turkmeniaca]TMR11728.1 hypothetical protein ETD86_34735 [Nonomuraea turkmeniaca]
MAVLDDRIKRGDSLEQFGRNQGGRYVHVIRGGKFVEGRENDALCWADVTKVATEKDRRDRREICWKCEEVERDAASPDSSEEG